jgi:predicted DNA-binding ArsR family transcriptional regulator
LNLTELSIILFIRFKNQEKVDNFIRKLKKYLEPKGVKSIDEILK